jgi:MmyB-like transcription regulator ligand binding domain
VPPPPARPGTGPREVRPGIRLLLDALERPAVGRYPDDEDLRELIDELTATSPSSPRCGRTRTCTPAPTAPSAPHPVAGPMTVYYEAMTLGDPDSLLYVYSAEPGTPSTDAMAALVALASRSSNGSASS